MNLSDLGDIANKQIEINSAEVMNPISSSSQNKQQNQNPQSNGGGFKDIINGFRGFMRLGSTSPNSSSNDNGLEMNNNKINIESNDKESQNNENVEKTKIDIYKEKIANFIISKIEVQKNYTIFLTLLALGCILLCMSLFTLPFIITSPSKFSMSFSFGCIFLLASFLFFYGTKTFISKLFEKNRFWISCLFILSIILGMIFSISGKYFFSLFCSLFQLFAMVMFSLTLIPGGRKGIEAIKKKMSSPFARVFMGMAAQELGQQ